MRPVGERIDDDEEEVMVADLRGDARRRPAGLFPAARGVGSGLSHDREAVDADDLFGTGFYSDAEIDGDVEDEAVIEKRESDDVEEEEVEVIEEGLQEEGRAPYRVKAPCRPSRKEREEHEATHVPFRSWCWYCVSGRGRNRPHPHGGSREEVEEHIPKISIDYFFFSKQDEKASDNPMLVMLDEETGDKFARATGRKGLGESDEMTWLIQDMSEELKSWGHQGGDGGHIILKSDGESSIVAVRDALSRMHGGRCIPEAPLKGESQSNGRVEEAGKTVREFVRVFKQQLEDKAKMVVAPDDVIVLWMIRWAAMIPSRYLVGRDGRTAYERRRGRRCKMPVVPFGESVWFRQLKDNQKRSKKFDSEWKEGVWLGQSRSSNESLIGTGSGVIRAWSVKRRPEGERWNAEAIRGLRGTPQQPDPSRPGMQIPVHLEDDDDRDESLRERDYEEAEPVGTRRLQIRRWMVRKYGESEDCAGCVSAVEAGNAPKREHTDSCRARFVELLSKDEEGRRILAREEARQEEADESPPIVPRRARVSGVAASSSAGSRDFDPNVASRQMERAFAGELGEEAPRYRTRAYLREAREEEADERHRYAGTAAEAGPLDDLRFLLRMSATDTVSSIPLDEEENAVAYDDVTGGVLDPKKVRAARTLEIGYAEKMNVWKKISRAEAKRRGIKVIKVRWIDINKGDMERECYRSRLVAKEFNTSDEEGLFAATPPLEGLKYLLSDAATCGGVDEKVVMVNDVSRAFFEAPIHREVAIELPPEARGEGDGDMVGLLLKSLYGTRDAAANFQKEVRRFMVSHGFTAGQYSPCTYFHRTRGIKVLVHGDDFVSCGHRASLAWFKGKLDDRFEIKTKVIGRGKDEVAETRILNRVVRMTSSGWEYEPDQRHVDLIVQALGLEKAKGCVSPGEELRPWEKEEDEEILDAFRQREYRSIVARANYLAVDRADIQYSVKELCRSMSAPRVGDWKKLKRLGRYLVNEPRVITKYEWQKKVGVIKGYSDSDWAGCRATAKSTSGGAVMAGSHLLKSWSTTQKSIALSSGEAELIALVKCSTEIIGMLQMLQDWGEMCEGELFVDSTAALGVVGRRGCGRMRHVRVGNLWLQERREEGDLKFEKILGTENPADLMTKLVAPTLRRKHCEKMGLESKDGRANESLNL
ncbi:reverse transcriptase domain-containing protein [bacterium]|nr:reverse transcriptase domain-containing protein [bacterium]